MLYSQYCSYAPQVRYFDFEQVKKQMYKIQRPHRQAGYITQAEYQQTTDSEGKPDWEMLYTPGPKAIAEYEVFTRRQIRVADTIALPAPPAEVQDCATVPSTAGDAQDSELLAEITRRGVAEKKARELLSGIKPGQEVMDQLEYVDRLVAKDTRGRLENPPGLYVFYLRDNVIPPADFVSSRKRRLAEQARQSKRTEDARLAQLKLDYEVYRAAEATRYIRDDLPAEEHEQLFQQHRRQNRRLFPRMSDDQLDELTQGTVRAKVQQSGKFQLMAFEEFIQRSKLAIVQLPMT